MQRVGPHLDRSIRTVTAFSPFFFFQREARTINRYLTANRTTVEGTSDELVRLHLERIVLNSIVPINERYVAISQGKQKGRIAVVSL